LIKRITLKDQACLVIIIIRREKSEYLRTMKSYHILNGDALADKLLHTAFCNDELIVCRECMIGGNLAGTNMNEFYSNRAEYLDEAYQVSKEMYFSKSVSDFNKILQIPSDSEVNLWFEDDLFCQTNMWFILSLLRQIPPGRVYRIFPVIPAGADTWSGFGHSSAELLSEAYQNRVKMSVEDLQLAANLWAAYKNNDPEKLKELSLHTTNSFHYLEEVCQAHADRVPVDGSPGRPERTILEIIETVSVDFNQAFAEFSRREGVYGFGDLQFKKIFDRLLRL
jgi:hypothetical protein